MDSGYICTPNSTNLTAQGYTSVCVEVCGNSIITISEECDDGNLINGDGCNSICKRQVGK